jgi:hypothetical protein
MGAADDDIDDSQRMIKNVPILYICDREIFQSTLYSICPGLPGYFRHELVCG